MTTRQKLIILCIIILSGNGIIGYTAYKRNEKQKQAEAWVEHTEKIILLSSNLLNLAKDIKNDAQSFVITRDISFLKPTQQIMHAFKWQIAELIRLTSDNKTQQKLVDSLNFHLNNFFQSELQLIESTRQKHAIPTVLFGGSLSGNFSGKRVQQIVHSMQGEERELLKKRKQINEKSATSLDHINILMFVLMTVFVFLLLASSALHLIHYNEKEKRILELSLAHKKINFSTREKKETSAALILANRELFFKNSENEKLAEEITQANIELSKIEADQKDYILELEKMMYMISHEVRQPVAHLMGLSNLFDQASGSSTHNLKKLLNFMKLAVCSLDVFTRDLTNQVGSMMNKRKNEK